MNEQRNLELLYNLIDEWNEVVEFSDVSLLEQTVHSNWNERKNVDVKTDDHTMKKLSHSLMQS